MEIADRRFYWTDRSQDPPDKQVWQGFQRPIVHYSYSTLLSWHGLRPTFGKNSAMSRILTCLFASFLFISSALAQHTVIMKDGSQKKGEVKSINGPVLNLFHNGRPLEMLVADVRTIHFYDEEKVAATSSTNLSDYAMTIQKQAYDVKRKKKK